ncbi:MAG: iron-containing alcohol dehydrogenase [Alphaproteobacteria bacterium]
MELSGVWHFPTSVRFGRGRLRELPNACAELGIARPLLVTDRGLADSAMARRALTLLEEAGLAAALFAEVQGNPVEANVDAGMTRLREGGHDGVVALGGGSALDVGKCLALMAGQRRPLMDFVDEGDNWRRVDPAGTVPLIAIPTTAGTGSEVGRSAVVIEAATRTKRVIFHPSMLPPIVLSDPELTLGLPAGLTAAVGMDALSHALEAYCIDSYHPMADGIAVEAMRLVFEWLPRAVADGSDIDARGHMLAAASMGAVAFQKGLGAMHAMSHPCSAVHDTHHGLTNAVLMPYVLAFNRPAIEARVQRFAPLLGVDGFAGVLDAIVRLRSQVGIPHTLGEIGVPADQAAALAPLAHADPLTGLNPRPVSVVEYETLYSHAFAGTLPN